MGITRSASTWDGSGAYVDYSSDGSNFIPEIWSGKLVKKFYPATVFGAIANTDYEGEIQNKGDTVHIRTVPDVTINDYEVGGGVTYEQLTSEGVDLTIDYAKSFSFQVNDVDKLQSDLEQLDKWATETSNKMKIQVDKTVLGSIYADVAPENAGASAGAISGNIDLGTKASPLALTKGNILDLIVDLGTVLDESDVDEEGRWLVLPAWACGLIKKSDLQDASLAGDGTSILRNGRIGMIDRFTIYRSNNLAVEADGGGGTQQVTNVVAGHKAGLTFASQMTNMESMRNPNDFGDLVRGLNLFGFEVINDTALAHTVISKG